MSVYPSLSSLDGSSQPDATEIMSVLFEIVEKFLIEMDQKIDYMYSLINVKKPFSYGR